MRLSRPCATMPRMTDTSGVAPASPSAGRLAPPRWLDARLVVGVLLVLVSVVVGARVLSAADRSEAVWSTTRELAPGTVLTEADLRRTSVRLFASAPRYLAGDGPVPTGYVLRRGLGAGELVPESALRPPQQAAAFRQVALNVGRGHWPPSLQAGQQVDVYVTVEGAGAASGPSAAPAPGGTRLVLAAVPVAAVPRVDEFGGGGDQQQVVLTVPAASALALVRAQAEGSVDLVRLPQPVEPAASAAAGPAE